MMIAMRVRQERMVMRGRKEEGGSGGQQMVRRKWKKTTMNKFSAKQYLYTKLI